MTPDPDVTPVGFAATDAPGAPLRRRRNPAWLAVALVLLAAGSSGIAWFVIEQAGNAPGRDQAVAEGRVAALDGQPTPPARFFGHGEYTVWLELDGVLLGNNRERIVAATNCVAAFGHGTEARFRGARQGASVTVNERSTVGTFTAPEGAVDVTCGQQPFGRLRGRGVLRAEREFFVTPGDPDVGWGPWIGLFGGIGLLIAAVPAHGRHRTGFVRPV